MIILPDLHDKDVFANPEFVTPESFTERKTVKAIIEKVDGTFGFVSNPVHKCTLLAGGGAESEDLEHEIIRECIEEAVVVVEAVGIIAKITEYRNRQATKYDTTCFLVKVTDESVIDQRTKEEKENGLQVEWLEKLEAVNRFHEQLVRLKNRELDFYNTAFNVVRDKMFWDSYNSSVLASH